MTDHELAEFALRLIRTKDNDKAQSQLRERFKGPATHEDALRFAQVILAAFEQVRDVPAVRAKLLHFDRLLAQREALFTLDVRGADAEG